MEFLTGILRHDHVGWYAGYPTKWILSRGRREGWRSYDARICARLYHDGVGASRGSTGLNMPKLCPI